MKKYVIEFIGTFFLVFAVCMSVIGGAGDMAPIAIGSVLMVMIYAGGHISGAHYNPAVTIALHLRGRCPAGQVPGYLISEFLGGIAGAFTACFLLRASGHTIPDVSQVQQLPSLIAEIIGTFAICFVVLNVATAKATAGNSYFGLAIGFTVVGCAYILGGISGGAFNLAVAVGGAFLHLFSWSQIWIYLVANIIAGILALYEW